MNYQHIMELSNVTEGMNIIQSSLPRSCQICLENKITKSPKSQEGITVHATKPLYRSYQRRTNSTADELFTGEKPEMRKLQQFGTPCIVYNEGSKQKLDACGREAIFLGINPKVKGILHYAKELDK